MSAKYSILPQNHSIIKLTDPYEADSRDIYKFNKSPCRLTQCPQVDLQCGQSLQIIFVRPSWSDSKTTSFGEYAAGYICRNAWVINFPFQYYLFGGTPQELSYINIHRIFVFPIGIMGDHTGLAMSRSKRRQKSLGRM